MFGNWEQSVNNRYCVSFPKKGSCATSGWPTSVLLNLARSNIIEQKIQVTRNTKIFNWKQVLDNKKLFS